MRDGAHKHLEGMRNHRCCHERRTGEGRNMQPEEGLRMYGITSKGEDRDHSRWL